MSTEQPTEDLSPAELCQHIEDMRRELIRDKLRIIELQDEIRERQSDHADAISLLGQAELLLEGKIEYILNLDQTLNRRIAELETECDRKSDEIERRGTALEEAESLAEKNRTERDAIIKDLSARLETANQEIGKAHALARDIDQDRGAKIHALKETENQLKETLASLAAAQAELAQVHERSSTQGASIQSLTQTESSLRETLQETREQIEALSTELKTEQRKLQTIKSSALWKFGRPWRALFGPKP